MRISSNYLEKKKLTSLSSCKALMRLVCHPIRWILNLPWNLFHRCCIHECFFFFFIIIDKKKIVLVYIYIYNLELSIEQQRVQKIN